MSVNLNPLLHLLTRNDTSWLRLTRQTLLLRRTKRRVLVAVRIRRNDVPIATLVKRLSDLLEDGILVCISALPPDISLLIAVVFTSVYVCRDVGALRGVRSVGLYYFKLDFVFWGGFLIVV